MSVLFKFEEPDYDEKATINKVKTFFQTDVPRLEDIARQSLLAALSSPKLDNVGSGGSRQNGVEQLMVNSVDAKRELNLIGLALNQCPEKYRNLIVDRYLKHLTIYETYNLHGYGYSRSRQGVYLPKALMWFAKYYARYGRDLRVQKNRPDKSPDGRPSR